MKKAIRCKIQEACTKRNVPLKLQGRLAAEDWPSEHREEFAAIERLGRHTYQTYEAQADDDIKRRAKDLATTAGQYRSENEATLRSQCEPIIFYQFSAERSRRKSEAQSYAGDVEAKARMSPRKSSETCRCLLKDDQGCERSSKKLLKIITCRSDEQVIHSPTLAEELERRQRPDLVCGLKPTKRLELLMRAGKDSTDVVSTLLAAQPSKNKQSGPLFPFFLVEAKRAAASDSWQDIYTQSSLPIYTLLNTQVKLKAATSVKSCWASGPLVWYLMYKGTYCKMSAVYPSCETKDLRSDNYTTMTTIVWEGSIDSCDAALQLLLIIGYIADWVTRVYRPSITRELSSLNDLEIASTFSDSDVYSERSHMTSEDLPPWEPRRLDSKNLDSGAGADAGRDPEVQRWVEEGLPSSRKLESAERRRQSDKVDRTLAKELKNLDISPNEARTSPKRDKLQRETPKPVRRRKKESMGESVTVSSDSSSPLTPKKDKLQPETPETPETPKTPKTPKTVRRRKKESLGESVIAGSDSSDPLISTENTIQPETPKRVGRRRGESLGDSVAASSDSSTPKKDRIRRGCGDYRSSPQSITVQC